jgi:NAD(P)-dependent dehydrogenase (short-subunit alcohol dehydrogenase family)
MHGIEQSCRFEAASRLIISKPYCGQSSTDRIKIFMAQTWFITGTSSGFGRAFADHALKRGYNVVATARRVSSLDDIVARAPERVLALTLDVTSTNDARAVVNAAVTRFGRIDVLINNAGYGIVGAFEETPDDELRMLMETSFFGAMNVTRAALQTLRAQRSGAIVNISSLGGQLSFAGFSAYSAVKFALEGASEALAQELKPFGVKVLIVEPGQFRTNLAGPSMRHMPQMDVYRDVVGSTRQLAHAMHGNQPGDPLKAAAAIETTLHAYETPLRLQLGADAVDAVREHSTTLLKNLAIWEALARNTIFDAA